MDDFETLRGLCFEQRPGLSLSLNNFQIWTYHDSEEEWVPQGTYNLNYSFGKQYIDMPSATETDVFK